MFAGPFLNHGEPPKLSGSVDEAGSNNEEVVASLHDMRPAYLRGTSIMRVVEFFGAKQNTNIRRKKHESESS